MREYLFSDEDLKAIDTDRYHHPHPHVQRKLEVLWLKSHGLAHQQIADLGGVSLRTVQRYLDDYRLGGLTLLRRCRWRGPKTALLRHEQSIQEYFWGHPPRNTKEAAKVIFEQTGVRRGLTHRCVPSSRTTWGCAISRWRPSPCRPRRPSKNTPRSRPVSWKRNWNQPSRKPVPAALPCSSSMRRTSSGPRSWVPYGAWLACSCVRPQGASVTTSWGRSTRSRTTWSGCATRGTSRPR